LEILLQFLNYLFDRSLQRLVRDRPFLACLGDARQELVPVKRLTASVALYDPKISPLNFLIGGESLGTIDALTAPTDASAILGQSRVNDAVFETPASGAIHLVVLRGFDGL
jgi:hypothetical protein